MIAAAVALALVVGADAAAVDEQLGARLPQEVRLVDSTGAPTTLGELVAGDRPTVLILAYERCTMLCGLVLRGAAQAVRRVGLRPGVDFRLVTLSIDPRERPAEAARVQDRVLAEIGRPGDRASWRFVVGGEGEIHAVADAIGFRYAWDARGEQFVHPAVITVIAPGGVVSRYLYGTAFSARDLRLALVEAADGKVGSFVDKVILACFRYDPAARRYGVFVSRFMRGGALVILVGATAMLAYFFHRERRRA